MKRLAILLMLSLAVAPLAACVVVPVRSGAVWVPGHVGPYGGWVRGHYA